MQMTGFTEWNKSHPILTIKRRSGVYDLPGDRQERGKAGKRCFLGAKRGEISAASGPRVRLIVEARVAFENS